jgi:DNA repair exonuclease SbcCD ATPase subunit
MKELRLQGLELQHFMGFTRKTVFFNPDRTTITGANGTGKTTIFNAWLWLLFGVDSQDRTKLYKPLDAEQNEIHNLETIVKGDITVNSVLHVLLKKSTENWVKKRGTTTESYTGNTIYYEINGIPRTETEYNTWIEENVCEKRLFKCVTDVHYFNNYLDQRQRREILIDLFSEELTDEMILAKNKELLPIVEDLQELNASADMLKAAYRNKKNSAKEQLDTIAPKISENRLLLSDISFLDFKSKKAEKSKIEGLIKEKETLIDDVRATMAKNSQILDTVNTLEREYRKSKDKAENLAYGEKQRVESELQSKKNLLETIKRDITFNIEQISMSNRGIETTKKDIDNLTSKHKKYSEKKKQVANNDFDIEKACPTCGRDFDNDYINKKTEIAIEKQVDAINTILDDLQTGIKQYSSNLKDHKQVKESYGKEQKDLIAQKEATEEKIRGLKEQLETMACYPVDYSECEKIKAQIEEQKKLIIDKDMFSIKTELSELKEQLQKVNNELSKADMVDNINNRIQELMNEEKRLAAKVADFEKLLDLADAYITTKVRLIEYSINSHFKTVNWKLFKEQVNGGIKEVCEASIGNATYTGTLNTGHKILAGYDCLEAISQKIGVDAPVFIDNSESLTIDIGASNKQIISIKAVEGQELTVK